MFALLHYQNKQRQIICKATLSHAETRPQPRETLKFQNVKLFLLKDSFQRRSWEGTGCSFRTQETSQLVWAWFYFVDKVIFLMMTWDARQSQRIVTYPLEASTESLSQSYQLELTPEPCPPPPLAQHACLQTQVQRLCPDASSMKGTNHNVAIRCTCAL